MFPATGCVRIKCGTANGASAALGTGFLSLSGLVKVTLDTPDGREIVLAVLGTGELLGEFEVIEGRPQRSAGTVAVLPLECRVIPGDEFMASLETHPQILLALVRVIISRLGAADRRREASASMGVSPVSWSSWSTATAQPTDQ